MGEIYFSNAEIHICLRRRKQTMTTFCLALPATELHQEGALRRIYAAQRRSMQTSKWGRGGRRRWLATTCSLQRHTAWRGGGGDVCSYLASPSCTLYSSSNMWTVHAVFWQSVRAVFYHLLHVRRHIPPPYKVLLARRLITPFNFLYTV